MLHKPAWRFKWLNTPTNHGEGRLFTRQIIKADDDNDNNDIEHERGAERMGKPLLPSSLVKLELFHRRSIKIRLKINSLAYVFLLFLNFCTLG